MDKIYVAIIALTVLIFAPPAILFSLIENSSGCPYPFDKDYYLGFCSNKNYGDYEHGAFYFNSESGVVENLLATDVLFLGNSKLQYTLSAKAIEATMQKEKISFYLFGFNGEGYEFPFALLKKYNPKPKMPKPKMVVINGDAYFYKGLTKEAENVIHGKDAAKEHFYKDLSQSVRHHFCPNNINYVDDLLCKGAVGIFRSAKTGAWDIRGLPEQHVDFQPIVSEKIDADIETMVNNAHELLNYIGVNKTCVILTAIPAPNTNPANTKELASRMGISFIAPDTKNLTLMDGYHLDRNSSERWSQDFIKAAIPLIRKCVNSYHSIHTE